MFKRLVLALSLPALVLSADCMARPKHPPPPLAGSIIVDDSPFALDKAIVHTSRIGDSQVFLVQKRGGNLAIGLLGGAILNSHLIARRSERMASSVSHEDSLDVVSLIKDRMSAMAPNALPESPHAFELAGALLISVDADDYVRSALVINARDTSTAKGWEKPYFYHFTTVMSAATFENGGYEELLRNISTELDQSIDATTGVVFDDLTGKLDPGTPLQIQSEFLRPLGNVAFQFQAMRVAERGDIIVMRVDGKPRMIRFPTVDGIHLFHPNQFEP